MKIICSKSNLLKSVSISLKAVPSKTTMPILECILMDATTNQIKFTTNDMELGIETIVEGHIEEKGMVALDAKIFYEIIRRLPDNDVTITTDSNFVATITCEKAKFTIPGKAGEDFAYLPVIEKDESLTLSQFTLKEMIRQTIFSIAVNENNRLMTGELFEIKDNCLKIVSLDADTVKVMSANFTNVQDEINQSLAEMNNSENAGVEATVTPAETTSIDMDNDHFTLRLKEFRVTQAIDDSDCLLLYCDYTNNSSSSSSALVDVQLSAKQNGEKLSPAVPKEDEPAIDNYIAEVEPGSTVTVCYAFSLNDKSDVTLEASEAFAFGGGNVTSQTIKLQ